MKSEITEDNQWTSFVDNIDFDQQMGSTEVQTTVTAHLL